MSAHFTRFILLLLGDALALYSALFLTLFIRYRTDFYEQFITQHFSPFSIVFALWLVVFYVAGLYDLRRLRNNLDFFKTLCLTLAVDAVIAILFFYLLPVFGITPRRNLFIFIALFALIEVAWRQAFNRLVASLEPMSRVVAVGSGPLMEELTGFLHKNPQLGYEITLWLKEDALPIPLHRPSGWQALLKEKKIDLVVVPPHFKKESGLRETLYHLLTLGVEVKDFPSFYETVFRKVPLAEISEEWFLEKIIEPHKFYDSLKRAGEFVAAAALGALLLPLEILIALIIALTSRGPVICTQIRVGRNGKPYTHYKFRTMKSCAEKDGPRWAEPNDERTTAVGKVLRASHLDELPQLINIIKGELSFVGPRPERPEFVKILAEKIPYYDIRHLIKPGITGWAQINYRYGASIEDAYHKLQYDVYYLKNRSIALDLAIVLKTLKSFFVNHI